MEWGVDSRKGGDLVCISCLFPCRGWDPLQAGKGCGGLFGLQGFEPYGVLVRLPSGTPKEQCSSEMGFSGPPRAEGFEITPMGCLQLCLLSEPWAWAPILQLHGLGFALLGCLFFIPKGGSWALGASF